MYFTSLPDHTKPGFDERSHFSKFKKHNIIFNALSRYSNCDHHVGCLSFKTVLSGEEWYGIGNRSIAVRPGQFLVMNDDQPYSCRIDNGESARVLSVFLKEILPLQCLGMYWAEKNTCLMILLKLVAIPPSSFKP
jgi:AraC family transcriptional regulator